MDTRSSKSSTTKVSKDSTSKDLHGQSLSKKVSCETDSVISISFDSRLDSGYRSCELSSPNVSTSEKSPLSDSSDSRTLSTVSQSKTYKFDSGLGGDCFTPLPSESDIYYSPEDEDLNQGSKETETEFAKHELLWPKIYDQDQDGDTILHLAVVEAQADIIFPIICQAPHPDFLDICNDLFQTPLHLSALTSKANVVRTLVVAGATLDIQDHNGNTALHIASRKGDVDSVLALITPVEAEEVAEISHMYMIHPQKCDLSPVINMKNFDGQTSLHFAALGGFKKVVECLYENGANINDQDGKSGKTALHFAVENLNSDLVKILLYKCSANPDARNYAGKTPLRIAMSLSKRGTKNRHVKDIVENLQKKSKEWPELSSSDTETASSSGDEGDSRH